MNYKVHVKSVLNQIKYGRVGMKRNENTWQENNDYGFIAEIDRR